MTALFSADEILEIAGARLASGMMPDDQASICIDTRLLTEGQWFLALPGQTFDGHDFIGDAFSRGAIGCIVEERTNYPIASTSFPLLAVGDTEEALCSLARSWRNRNQAKLCLLLKAGDQSEKLLKDLEGAEGAFDASLLLKPNVDWQEIALALLELSSGSKALVLEYQPRNLEHINIVATMTAPDVVLVLADAFSHLRLQMSAEQIMSIEQFLADCALERLGVVFVAEDTLFRQTILDAQIEINIPKEDTELSFAPDVDFAPTDDFFRQEKIVQEGSVVIIDDRTDLVQRLMDILRVRQN
ncbi:MAG: Mur ligase domain-containing protein [Candidatus Obscuribacterales bacterium]|nr:Mur ligase domain-containing protein [Candidatus Obscuribacterales bacterium]